MDLQNPQYEYVSIRFQHTFCFIFSSRYTSCRLSGRVELNWCIGMQVWAQKYGVEFELHMWGLQDSILHFGTKYILP